MSTVNDNMLFQSDTTKKYDIPLSHLDYSYIGKCTDVKELERIYKVLRSGDEGFYPDLEKFCEEKIEHLNPKSRVLRKEVPLARPGDLAKDEWQHIDNDLKNWEMEMKASDSNKKKLSDEFDDPELPPIRSGVINGHAAQENQTQETKNKNKRVKPRDYKEWDKFDIDKELEEADKKEEKKPTKKSKPPQIETNINTAGLTGEEKVIKAGKEKEKGNEAFRAGDYEESIAYYTRSLKLHSTAASYNNRAIAYIKTSQWASAAEDCNRVLKLEPENIKALLRRGTAYKGMKEFIKAQTDYNRVIELEPENKRAQDLLLELETEEKKFEEEKQKRKEKGRRMVIEEVDEESEDEIIIDKKPHGQNLENEIVNGHSDIHHAEKIVEKPANHDAEEKRENEGVQENVKNKISKNESKKKDASKSESRKDDKSNENKIEDKTSSKDIWTENELNNPVSDTTEPVKQESENRTSENNQEGSQLQSETENRLGISRDSKDSRDSSSETGQSIMTKEKEIKTMESEKIETLEDGKGETVETNGAILERPVFVQGSLPKGVRELRESGNTLFKAGQYGDAIHKYSVAIEKLQKEKTDERVNLSLLYSNRAACFLKTGDCPHTIDDCTTALELVPHSMKPLLRRANAHEVLERYRPAYADYKHVLSIDSSVDMALQGASRCQKHLMEVDGTKWREKLPRVPSVQSWEIPEIVDNSGQPTQSKPISSYVPSSSTQPINSSVPSNSSSKKKSSEELFEESKAEGNSFVQKGEYEKAVPCYTKCTEILPDKAVSYTNRSLCYLKLNKATEAESDCSKALSLEKDNVKALFRRAQARKILKKHKESIEDLSHLLKVDPKNTAAKKDMECVKDLWRKQFNDMKKQMEKPAEKKPRKRIVIEETDSEEEQEQKSETKAKTKSTKATNSSSKTDTTQNTKQTEKNKETKLTEKTKSPSKSVSDQKNNETTKTDSEKGSVASKKSLKSASSSIKQTSFGLPQSVPKLEKATPYEFITAWNSLRQSTDLQPYAELLRQIPPADLPKVISNKLDGGMLSKIAKCVAEKFADDTKTSYQILMNVSKVPRFDTIAMFMSKNEKKDIEKVFNKVESTDMASKEEISQLRKKYSL